MAQEVHCLYCFDVLASHLHQTQSPDPPFPTDASFPLFVTWNKRNQHGQHDLRGCIGCLSPLPITSLKDYALTSALNDRRFAPIDARELPQLQCTVSLLTNFELASGLYDWEIGLHGVQIDYADPMGQVRKRARAGLVAPAPVRPTARSPFCGRRAQRSTFPT